MNLLKLIPLLLCVLALTIPTTVDAGRKNRNRKRNSATTTTTTTTTSNPNLDSYGFPRFDYLKQKSVNVTNWTQYNHNNEDKDIHIQATCLKRQKTSGFLNAHAHDFYAIVGTEADLPATGRDVSATEGRYERESCVGIRLIRRQESSDGTMIIHFTSVGAIPLYKNFKKLPSNVEGYTIIGTDCNKSHYRADIRYLPANRYDQPVESEDPDGYYALIESCR